MASLLEIRKERMKKIETLVQHGMPPYPSVSNRTDSLGELLRNFAKLEKSGEQKTIAGRVMSMRNHGGSAFFDIFDGTGRLQVFIRKAQVGGDAYQLFLDTVDLGDFLDVAGKAMVTKVGEKSLLAESWRMLAKSLRPIPTEWYSIKDEESRLRKRYLDILLHHETAELIRKKSVFWNTIRTFLLERDFTEVETPVLETTTGGAEARPFATHHHALDIDVFLRISAGELWQKRLMVAGLPRTFEIGRIFRNEGISHEHLQDYTQLEFYMAYSDYTVGMDMVCELYRTIAKNVLGTTTFTTRGFSVDVGKKWKTYNFTQLMQKHYDLDPLAANEKEIQGVLAKHNVTYDMPIFTKARGIDALWKNIRKTLDGPGFLIGVPVYLEPLAKRSAADQRIVERFQVIIAGSELGKGFSELNDPIDQRERFVEQQSMRDKGDVESQMADMEYVEALEYGMPPTFGFGLSERFFSYLVDKSVREAQIFPLLKQK